MELPSAPGPRREAWRPVRFGGDVQGALGGAMQTINRLGDRWALGIEIPPLTPVQAREWSAALVLALRSGALWKIRQVGSPTGNPGTPAVDGASQAGDLLLARAIEPGYAWRQGQFLSIDTGGQRYVHMVTAAGTADGTGEGEIDIVPPLRVSPGDGDTVELGQPYIEGALVWEGWALDPDRLARGFAFEIVERR